MRHESIFVKVGIYFLAENACTETRIVQYIFDTLYQVTATYFLGSDETGSAVSLFSAALEAVAAVLRLLLAVVADAADRALVVLVPVVVVVVFRAVPVAVRPVVLVVAGLRFVLSIPVFLAVVVVFFSDGTLACAARARNSATAPLDAGLPLVLPLDSSIAAFTVYKGKACQVKKANEMSAREKLTLEMDWRNALSKYLPIAGYPTCFDAAMTKSVAAFRTSSCECFRYVAQKSAKSLAGTRPSEPSDFSTSNSAITLVTRSIRARASLWL